MARSLILIHLFERTVVGAWRNPVQGTVRIYWGRDALLRVLCSRAVAVWFQVNVFLLTDPVRELISIYDTDRDQPIP